MSKLKWFEDMVETKLLNIHTVYIAKVLSTDGKTAKIQPLGKTKAYGEEAKSQSPLSDIPIIYSARWKLKKVKLQYVENVVNHSPIIKYVDILVPTDIAAGDLVVCVCGERDITEAKKGNNTVPALGHHSMSASVIVGIL